MIRRAVLVVPLLLGAAGAALAMAPASPAAHPHRGRLVVDTAFDYSGGRPIEGSLTFMRVRTLAGRLVLARQAQRLDRRLRPGRYRLTSYQRFCDANCGTLDPPALRCHRRIRIRPGRTLALRVTVQFFDGCRIERAP